MASLVTTTVAGTASITATTNDGSTAPLTVTQAGTARAAYVTRNVASATRAMADFAQLHSGGGAHPALHIQQTTTASDALRITSDGATAKFAVTGTGALTATSGTFTGAVTAGASSTFSVAANLHNYFYINTASAGYNAVLGFAEATNRQAYINYDTTNYRLNLVCEANNGSIYLLPNGSGNVNLYYGTANKLQTVTGGVNVNGTLTAGGGDFGDQVTVAKASSGGAGGGIVVSNTNGDNPATGGFIDLMERGTEFGVFDNFGFRFLYDGDNNVLNIKSCNGTTIITPLSIARDTGAATFSSALTIGAYTLPNTDGTAGYHLQTNGSGTVTWAAGGGTVTGSGTDNYIPRWNGTTALHNSIIYDSGASVGISSVAFSSPAGTLHTQAVGGNITYLDAYSLTDGTGSLMIFRKSASATVGKTQTGNGDSLGTFTFYGVNSNPSPDWGLGAAINISQEGTSGASYVPAHMAFSTCTASAYAEQMRITSAGFVGIGTASPDCTLHIEKLTGGTDVRISAGNYGTNYGGLNLDSASFGISSGNAVRALGFSHTNQKATFSGSVTVEGDDTDVENLYVNQEAIFDGNAYPYADSSYTLGTSALRWSTIYGDAGNFSGALTGTTATFSGGSVGWYNAASIRGHLGMTGNEGDLSIYRSSAVKHVYLSSYYDCYINPAIGNVGIGTTAPATPLHVWSTSYPQFRVSYNSALYFTLDHAATLNVYGNDWYVRLNGSEKFRIKQDGKIGIGTNNPLNILTLHQAAGANIRFSNPTTGRYFVVGEGVGANDKFSFRGNSYRSTDTLTVDFANNRVGVANISPSYALDVVGYIKASLGIKVGGGSAGNSTNPAIRCGSVNTAGVYFVSSGVGLGSGSSTKMLFLNSSGSVGIGTETPGYKLEVKGSNTGDWISRIYNTATTGTPHGLLVRVDNTSSSATHFGVYSGAAHTFAIRGDGNVGIGTTSPAKQLHLQRAGGAWLRIQETGAEAWDLYGGGSGLYILQDGTYRFAFRDDGTQNHYGNRTVNSQTVQGLQDGGACYNFDGSNDYIELASNGKNYFGMQQTYTIAGWVNMPDATPSTSSNVIFSYDYTSHANPYYAIHIRIQNAGKMEFYWNDGSNYKNITTSAQVFTDNTWHHFACTYTSGTHKIYIDGVEVTCTGDTTQTGTITFYDQEVWIGKGNFGGNFPGKMRSIQYFPSSLSAGDVQKLYNGENPKRNTKVDLLTNGDFSSATGWSVGNWTVSGGKAVASDGDGYMTQGSVLSTSKKYLHTITLDAVSGNLYLYSGTGAPGAGGYYMGFNSPGTYTFIANAFNSTLGLYCPGGTTATVDSIRTEEITTLVDLTPRSGSPTVWYNSAVPQDRSPGNGPIEGAVSGATLSSGATDHSVGGNVGIGTDPGAYKLSVDGTIYSSGTVTIANNKYYAAMNTGATSYALLKLNASNQMEIGASNMAAQGYPARVLAKYITFEPAGSIGAPVETMRITNGSVVSVGSVGIGTASPSTMLHVTGTTFFKGACEIDSALTLGGAITSTSGATFTSWIKTANYLYFNGATGRVLLDTADGADTKALYVGGGGDAGQGRGAYVGMYGNDHASTPGRLELLSGTDGSVAIYSGGTERLTIANGGAINLAGALTVAADAVFQNSTHTVVSIKAQASGNKYAMLYMTSNGTQDNYIRADVGDLVIDGSHTSVNITKALVVSGTSTFSDDLYIATDQNIHWGGNYSFITGNGANNTGYLKFFTSDTLRLTIAGDGAAAFTGEIDAQYGLDFVKSQTIKGRLGYGVGFVYLGSVTANGITKIVSGAGVAALTIAANQTVAFSSDITCVDITCEDISPRDVLSARNITASTGTFSSFIRANYGIQDDSGGYGTSGQVLKSGGTGVVNWANESGGGDTVTIDTTADDILSVSAGDISGVDANTDKLVYWDEGLGKLKYLTFSDLTTLP